MAVLPRFFFFFSKYCRQLAQDRPSQEKKLDGRISASFRFFSKYCRQSAHDRPIHPVWKIIIGQKQFLLENYFVPRIKTKMKRGLR